MKKIVLIVGLLCSIVAFSQDVLMQNGTVNSCSGTFFDSGGASGNYGNNESLTLTICPDMPGGQSQLDFTAFNLQQNADFLTIYNGPNATYDPFGTFNANAPGQIRASLTAIVATGQDNPQGCLTIVFSSDGVTANTGWTATISCFEPCQDIQSQIDNTFPPADANNVVQICQGDQVEFNGSGIFSIDGTGATYDWDFGNGTSGTGTNTTATYTNEGIFLINLVITDTNPAGCTSNNISQKYVHVSSTPDFTGTEATEKIICLGEETTIEGSVSPVTVTTDCANGGEQTVLGDVQGFTFTSALDLNCFQGQSFTDISQLESICIVMEHSYMGDLEIAVISPDGTRVLLHNQTGVSLYIGNPVVTDGTGAGVGWEYCFSMFGTTILSDGPRVNSGTPTTGLAVEAGTYLPVGNFNDFIGNQIDGQWTLEIIDHLTADDGTIFSWSLNFDESLLASDFTFTPTITSESWDADLSITNTVGSTITVQPNVSGTQCYTYKVLDDFGCEYTEQVCIEVLPDITPIQPMSLEECDDTIADGLTTFDLSLKDNEITGGNTNWSVAYFENNLDAQNDANPINPANDYTNTVNSQIVFVRVTDVNTGCFGFTQLELNVLANPASLADAPDLELCDDTNPGDGQEVFDITFNEAYIVNGELGMTVTYHETDADAQSGVNDVVNPTAYTNIGSPQTIFVRVTNDLTGCFIVVNFDIIVNQLPSVTAVTDLVVCEVNFDGINQFDLESKKSEILNGQSTTDFMVTYHEIQVDADAGLNPLTSPYTNLTNPQLIFVNIININTGCSVSTVSFNIEEINNPTANTDLQAINYELCDNFGANDGVAQFDLTTLDADILDGQPTTTYGVTYYISQSEADLGINPLNTFYENISNPQILYARVDGVTAPNTVCYATARFTLNVNLLPDLSLDNNYVICVNPNGSEVVSPPLLDTGLSIQDYIFEWRFNGNVLTGETGPYYLVSQPGDYSVTVSDVVTGCQAISSTTVSSSSPPNVSATLISLAFSDNNVIEVLATGSGNYQYSLDNGPWQDNNVFEDISIGEHIIIVIDLNGCGIDTTTVVVMDYPKYFTPNGDGYNDTWNITGMNAQPNAEIFIYDRYGKLVKQLNPTGNGWNGTFNGYNLPAADYWFTIKYNEPSDGILKEFKAHFTLKR